jgi:ABC-type cobalamin/Fe3+-siderophores transport system ATPase subunit
MTAVSTLSCHGIGLRAGQRELLCALELAVQPGERWVVLGPNGAGKSSLLAVLAGVRCAHAGEVRLAGQDINGLDGMALAAQRALLTDRWLDPFSATVLDTVLTARFRFAGDAVHAAAQAREALTRLDCAELPERDVRTLSRGERQRVALATALLQDTPLLLLDEPTAHQDPRHQALVFDLLAQLGGRTIIATVHDINAAARFATHVLLLSGHGPWQAGPVDAVLTTTNLSTLFGTRFGEVQADGQRLFHLAA